MAAGLERPNEKDCCGSGCNPCIFDVYEQKLKQAKLESLKSCPDVLNELLLTTFVITEIKEIATNINLYTFQLVDSQNKPLDRPINLRVGDYLILKATFEENGSEKAVSRPYTPIINQNLATGSFQMIIRLYENGKMSNIIEKFELGEITYWRGPYNHLRMKVTKKLVLLGAGTGVVPLYNIASELVQSNECESLILFIGCFSNIDAILLRDELQSLSGYWNFNCEFYISKNKNVTQSLRYNEKITFSKFSDFSLKSILSESTDLFLIICGPDTFNEHFKTVGLNCGLCENENMQVL